MELDLYKEELALEEGMIQYGKDRYRAGVQKAEEQGRGSETSYARRLLSVICKDLAIVVDVYTKTTGPGKGANARVVLRKLSPDQSAFIALKSIFDSLIREEPLVSIAMTIGARIEDQIRFTEFQEDVPDLYNYIVQEFRERNVVNYRRKHRVLVNAHQRQSAWSGLTVNQRVQLGTKLIEMAITATGMFDVKLQRVPGGKTFKVLYATDETVTWIEEHVSRFELLYPDFSPTVIPPKPWTNLYNGGYYLEPLRKRYSFIKSKSKVQRDAIKGHDYSTAMGAVNKIQETGWRINQFVLETMQDVWRRNMRIGMPPSEPYSIPPCPFPKEVTKEDMSEQELIKFKFWKKECSDLYSMEKQRVSKCMLLGRILSSAVRYTKYDAFYFVYNCDFRGRIYAASSGFSPQGPDIAKGVLEFSTGKALGATGFRWLCIHGANTYGYDKASYDDRVSWCEERKDQLVSIGNDPFGVGCVDAWKDADKPYQFLAFCREYSQAIKDQEGFISHLPIALDGSCNGLQHFSAILRDEVGGKAVNLLPADVPQDIYGEVAVVTTNKLKGMLGDPEDTEEHACKALAFGVTRKICKKPVMTLPYGSTQRNCLIKTAEYIKENPETSIWKDDMYRGATFLGNTIWGSIGDVVIAARSAMKWLRAVSSILSKENYPIYWLTPTGFLMYQSMMELNRRVIKTQLLGTVKLTIVEDTPTIDRNRQANGISPNFVHSLDAAHLCMSVNASNFDSYAMIHDSFGTHACDTDDFARILREQFIKMYTEHDVLQELKDTLEERYNVELPDLPIRGSLDVNEVLNSPYFFG